MNLPYTHGLAGRAGCAQLGLKIRGLLIANGTLALAGQRVKSGFTARTFGQIAHRANRLVAQPVDRADRQLRARVARAVGCDCHAVALGAAYPPVGVKAQRHAEQRARRAGRRWFR